MLTHLVWGSLGLRLHRIVVPAVVLTGPHAPSHSVLLLLFF